jgi:hypothetical protein
VRRQKTEDRSQKPEEKQHSSHTDDVAFNADRRKEFHLNPSNSASIQIVLLILAGALGLPAVAQNPCNPDPAGASPATAAPPCLAPLTPQARLQDFLQDTFGPEALLGTAAGAGIGQARNHPSAWEQGMAGYGRRYGSSFGKHLVDHTIRLGVESVLGEDSRFLPSPRKETWSRIGHAVRQTFVARRGDGKETIAVGRLAGAIGGGMISRTWQPAGHDGFLDGLQSGGLSFSFDIGLNVFHEFWPDLRKHLPFSARRN